MSSVLLKKFRYCCFCLPILFLLSGCTSTPTASGTFAVNMKYCPQSLDPRQTRLFADQTLARHLYEGLMQENSRTGEIELALAKSYTISEDKITYTFHLKDAFWSNGDPVTSLDFLESWDQVVRHKVVSIYNINLQPIKNARQILANHNSPLALGVEAPDPKTLVVTLEEPCSHFLRLLSLPIYFPAHKTLRENPLSKDLQVTCGAFYPKEQHGQQWLRLSKNPQYYEKDRVRLKEILVYFVADPRTAALLFNQNKINWQGPPWGEPIPSEISSSLSLQGKLLSTAGHSTTWLLFNTERPILSHPKIRKALALAINKDDLVHVIFQGLAEPTNHILKQKYYPKPYPLPSSQTIRTEEARKLFEEAMQEMNISREDLEKEEIAFSTLSSSYEKIAQLLREQWKEALGITLPLARKEFSLLQQALYTKQYSMVITQWLDHFLDPMATLSAFLYPQGVIPYSINDPLLQSLCSALSQEHDPELRDNLIVKATEYLETQHVLEPLFHPYLRFALNKNLKNINLPGRRAADLRFVEDLGKS